MSIILRPNRNISLRFGPGIIRRIFPHYTEIYSNSTEIYVKSKIAKIIHKYGGTILVDFNVGIFDIFAISHTLNLILMPGFDNI